MRVSRPGSPGLTHFNAIVDADEIEGTYTTSDRITATFVVDEPLSPNPSSADITASLSSIQLSDGRNSLDQNEAVVLEAIVSTNSFRCSGPEPGLTIVGGSPPEGI